MTNEADATESILNPDLVNFLQERIPTVEHLEALLLVCSSPEYWWTVRAVNDLLRSREDSIRSRLKELCEQGLLERKAKEDCYRLKADAVLGELIQRLRVAYKTFPVRVVKTIYAPKAAV